MVPRPYRGGPISPTIADPSTFERTDRLGGAKSEAPQVPGTALVHGLPDDAVCAEQSVDGSAQAFTGTARISLSEIGEWTNYKGEMLQFPTRKPPNSSPFGISRLSGRRCHVFKIILSYNGRLHE